MQKYADAVVINNKDEILFLRRGKFSSFAPNKYGLPGGHIDKGETSEQAVERELFEESGLEAHRTVFLKKYKTEEAEIDYFFVEVKNYNIVLDESEHHNYCWMSLREVLKSTEIIKEDLKEIIIDCVEKIVEARDSIQKSFDDMSDNGIVLTEEGLVNLIEGGSLIEGINFWGDIQKASTSGLRKIKKLVVRDGRTYLGTYWVNPDSMSNIKKEGESVVLEGGKYEFSVGDIISVRDKEGKEVQAKIESFKHDAKTDKYGAAIVTFEGGGKGTISLRRDIKKIKDAKSGKTSVESSPKAVKPVESKKSKIEDLELSKYRETLRLGGSSEVHVLASSDGEIVVRKKRRSDLSETNKQLEQEVLTDRIYREVTDFGIDSDMIEGHKVSEYLGTGYAEYNSLSKEDKKDAREKLKEGFVLDCLLANWDVIGAGYDNIMCKRLPDGTMSVKKIDNGGALNYRARGTLKGDLFSDEVTEIETFLSSKNPSSKEIFEGITEKQIKEQFKKLEKDFPKILKQIDSYPHLLRIAKNTLKVKLQARFDYLNGKYGEGVKSSKKAEKEVDKGSYLSGVTNNYFKDWDSLEMDESVNSKLKSSLKERIVQAEALSDKKLNEYAKRRGMNIEEYKQRLQTLTESIVSKAEFFRATRIDVLEKICNAKSEEDFRYKTQFEVGESGGSYNPSMRKRVEATMFGYKKENLEKRPIYGFFTDNTNGIQSRNGKNPPSNHVHQYGEIQVKIKRDIALKKATITMNDSFYTSHSDEGKMTAPPVPAAKPHFTLLCSHLSAHDPLEYYEDYSLSSPKTSSYTEVQYHGGVRGSDFESVHLSAYDGYEEKKLDLKRVNKVIRVVSNRPEVASKLKIYES